MNKVKEALLNGKITLGSWIQTGNPVAAEIIANAGYDWIGIDCEHSSITTSVMSDVMRAIGEKAIPLVRVQTNNTLDIRRALDMGAGGVIVPMINNKNEAEHAVNSVKYPPVGVRGFGYCRANGWGKHFDEYAKSFNNDSVVIAMIETREGVENIEEILSVDGIDGVFIGPYDLSGSLGVTGQTGHPLVKEACDKVALACKKLNKAAGLHIVRPDKAQIESAKERGFTFIALGADIVYLLDGAENTKKLFD